MACAVPDSKCARCQCENNLQACSVCVLGDFKCTGTCLCCEENRKILPSSNPSVTGEGLRCHSECKSDTFTRNDCPEGKILLREACIYYQAPKKKENNEKSADEKVLDNPQDKVPHTETEEKGETSVEPHSATSQITNSEKKLPEVSAQDTKNMHKVMCCPRCLSKVGAGLCDICFEQSDKSSNGVLHEEKNRPSTHSPVWSEHGNYFSISSTYTPSYSHPSTLHLPQIANLARSAAAIARARRNQMNASNSFTVIESYCLNCECRGEDEPCTFCKTNPLQCYGSCACCKELNTQMLNMDLPQDSSEKFTIVEEFDELNTARMVATDTVPTDPVGESTNEVHCDHCYAEIIRCPGCNCIRNSLTCEDCITFNRNCTFTRDEEYCSCCRAIKYDERC